MKKRAKHLQMIAREQAAASWAYALRIREAFPEVVQGLRETAPLSMHELQQRSQVQRETVSQIEDGGRMSNLFTIARIAFVLAGNLTEFARQLDAWQPGGGRQKRQAN